MLSSKELGILTTAFCECVDHSDSERVGLVINRVHDIYGKVVTSDLNMVVNDEQLQVDAVVLHAVINTSVFTIVNEDDDLWALENLELICQCVLDKYIEISEYDGALEKEHTTWWEDAVEFGLTGYAQATKHYNMD